MKRLISLALAILLCVTVPYAMAQNAEAPIKQALLNAYENDAFLSSTNFQLVEDLYVYAIYESLNDTILALMTGKSDYVNLPSPTAEYVLASNDAFEMGDTSGDTYYFMGIKPENTQLRDELSNGILALKENGTLDELIKTYLTSNAETPAIAELPIIEGAKTIRVGVTGDIPPMDYIDASGMASGFNVALLTALSKELNVNVELVRITASARLLALTSGKIDALFYAIGFEADPKGSQDDRVLLTESYYSCGMKRVCRTGELDRINESMNNMATVYAQRAAQ